MTLILFSRRLGGLLLSPPCVFKLKDITMFDIFDFAKNILASLVSIVSLSFFLFKYLNKKDSELARTISNVIRESTSKAFEVAHIERRVRELEEAETKNTEAIRELGTQLNARLDQLFMIVAQTKGHE